MSILQELIAGLIGAAGGPESDRGLIALWAGTALALSAATSWLFLAVPDPVQEPEWSPLVIVGCLSAGVGGMLLSILHLRRTDERLFGLFALASSALALATPAFWLVTTR